MNFVREVRIKYGKPKSVLEPIKGPETAAAFIRKKVIRENNKEHMVLLCLDGSHQVFAWNLVSLGTANMTIVHPREIFQPAILAGSVSIIVAHNHPSGNLDPSAEDIKATKQLCDAGKLLGIRVLDHIIVTESGFVSLNEHGHIS